jgi:hypothetical protein
VFIVQDIHQVIGRRELDFEGLYRETITPSLTSDAATRLALFAWSPHGAGEGYEAVTLTTVEGGEALDRYQERIRFGDLGETWTGSEAMRYSLHSSAHVLQSAAPGWEQQMSPGSSASPFLCFLDILELSVPVDAAAADLGKLISDDDGSELLSPLAWWSPLFGDVGERSVTILSRVTSDDAIKTAFSPENAAQPWGRNAEDALSEVVIRAHRRLLRSPGWAAEQPQ